MMMLDLRHLMFIVAGTALGVVLTYIASQFFDFIIALYTSVTTAIAFTIALEVRHNERRRIHYKNTVGIPTLRKSLRDTLSSLQDIKHSIEGDMHHLAFNFQVSNTLQNLHYIRSEVARYSVEGVLPSVIGPIIYHLGSPLFIMQEETMDQKDTRLHHIDITISILRGAIEEFDTLYK